MTQTSDILTALTSHRIVGMSELDAQNGIENALAAAGIEYSREHRLSDRDRIDFLVGTVGIEVKIKGSRSALIRQLGRYARSDEVDSLILASSVRRLLYAVPDTVLSKPVHKHLLQGGLR